MTTLQPGDEAPDFVAVTDQNATVSLRDFRGKKVILYFYPADDTPGCTVQACGFRDHSGELEASNTVILGVSADDVDSHTQFKNKFALPFTLLVDADHAIAQAYGVWKEKTWFGLGGGVTRSHFVIDETGKIAAAAYKIGARDSVSQALLWVREM